MIDFYMTDFGPVRVSPVEMMSLRLAEDIRRLNWEAKFPGAMAKAEAIEAACREFAQSKVEAE